MHIPASDLHVYELGQDEIDAAPAITFGQFRALAAREGWTEAFLIEQCKSHIDNPTETVRRILKGTDPEGHRLVATVIPYQPLIELYRKHHVRPVPRAVRSRIRSMYAQGYDYHRLSCYFPAYGSQLSAILDGITPDAVRRCKCGCGKKPARRSQYADPSCRVRVARRKRLTQTR
jgi:hypothetical protein